MAAVFGFPVAAKLASRKVQHKTELGAVKLSLADADQVRTAYRDIVKCAPPPDPAEDGDGNGVLVQPMIVDAIETFVGVTEDPAFGPLVGFGLGGTHVEVMGDVRFRVAPLTGSDAEELLHEIRGQQLLQGYRGQQPADLDALQKVLLRVSRLAEAVPEIVELDLNPVMALAPGKGCRIVDARIRVARARTAGAPTAPAPSTSPESRR